MPPHQREPGAQLEGSKAYMKGLLAEAGVPTARYGTFTEAAPARAFLDTMAPPFVIKTDGLAAGKGVLVTDDLAEARNTVDDYLSGRAFGDAGPVSYTHLDVYKRQVMALTSASSSGLWPKNFARL